MAAEPPLLQRQALSGRRATGSARQLRSACTAVRAGVQRSAANRARDTAQTDCGYMRQQQAGKSCEVGSRQNSDTSTRHCCANSLSLVSSARCGSSDAANLKNDDMSTHVAQLMLRFG